MGARRVAVVVGVVLSLAGGSASATSRAGLPLGVTGSTLAQAGQQLIWTVSTTRPLRPESLARRGLSLCLLLQERSGRARLCVAAPGVTGGSARILEMPSEGAPFYIYATVTRPSSRQLTAAFTVPGAGLGYRVVRWQVISARSMARCSGGGPCASVFPRVAAVLRLHVPMLVGCVPRGPGFVYSGPTDRKQIALTFDDGPWYQTPEFLSLLERYHVPATFFEIGDQIADYGGGGAIERRMLADGDMIGDHTWNHRNVSSGGSFARREITRAAMAIRDATNGFEPCLFRAPDGAVSRRLIALARSLGFTTIQWDVDPRDWASPGVAAIYDRVLDQARPGAIVEQHDGGGDRSETLAALPTEIRVLRSRGYQFVTVTQLLGMRLLYR